jgi:hypothetical protein
LADVVLRAVPLPVCTGQQRWRGPVTALSLGAGAYAGPSAALAGLGHVGVASAASRLGPQAVDPITGALQGVSGGC